jgi:hypothetical protein
MNRLCGGRPVPRELERWFRAAFLGLVALLLLLPAPSRAESLRATFTPVAIQSRSNAPALFEIQLKREGAGLLEGNLEITFLDGGFPVLRQRTPALSLTAGTQTFRLCSPPMPPARNYYGGRLEASVRFVTKTGATHLGEFGLEPESPQMRKFVIAVCDGHNSGARDGSLWQSLRLETFYSGNLRTAPAFLEATDFPVNPLLLTAFDIVLLEGDGFAGMREKQLAALTRWVEAGGHLYVIPRVGLKEEHARFLNAFAAADSPVGRVSEVGAWITNGAPLRLLRAGLGRVAVDVPPDGEVARTMARRRAGGFLWKVNPAIAEPIIRGESPEPAPPKSAMRDEANMQNSAINSMLSSFLPKTTRLISPWMVALLLLGFLVVIGPVDWFVLGLLRRRRWTWIFFPLAAVGCTGLMVLEANRTLGRNDRRGIVIFTDLGPGGRVLRESRFELLITGKDKAMTSDFHNALVLPRAAPGGPEVETWIEGQVPTHSTLQQTLRQWAPQITRTTSFEAAAAVPDLPWEKIDAQIFQASTASFDTLLPGWNYAILSGREKAIGRGLMIERGGMTREVGLEATRSLASSFASEMMLVTPGKVPGRNAPHGGMSFDDLQMLDPRDDRERLLVLYRPIPDGMQVYRRLYLKPE